MTTDVDGEFERTGEQPEKEAEAVNPPQKYMAKTPSKASKGPLWKRGLTSAVKMGVDIASIPINVARPVVMSGVMQPAREAANQVVGSVSGAMSSVVADQLTYNDEAMELVDAFVQAKLKTLAADPAVTQLIVQQADRYLAFLISSPERVGALVEVVATRLIETLAQRPEVLDALVEAVAARYIAELSKDPEPIRPLVEEVVARYLVTLQEQPQQLDGLVTEVATRFMRHTRENPAEVNKLVQVVGDKYMDYLNEYPDDVQQLLAGQTAGMTKTVVEGVRDTSTLADGALDKRIRGWLRLKPRNELPQGPENVTG